jgi:hypothetical protein
MTITTEQLANFLAGAKSMRAEYLAKISPNLAYPDLTFTAEEGPKFIRIVVADYPGQRSAFCFLNKATGDILKSDGWKAPAKGARGNINTPTFGVEYLTPYGAQYRR